MNSRCTEVGPIAELGRLVGRPRCPLLATLLQQLNWLARAVSIDVALSKKTSTHKNTATSSAIAAT